ncbi:MAG: ribulose-phosphate 3-epimerase [Chitinophagales bacterium]|jgi:ribulose-phosphate 3-epimerase|nr:ribulose-phosphate 3-epimerase [Chitinophagales bacterium]
MPTIIAPSILAADFANLQKDIQLINDSDAQWVHFDVMDGVFVPNISFGFPLLQAVKRNTSKFIDVHLMIVNPEKYINEFVAKGADGISVHYEGNLHIHSVLQQIKNSGAQAGLALNPHTPVSVVKEILHLVDTLLIMSVNPGFGGQKFIPETVSKVSEAKKLIQEANTSTLIQVDGGVNIENCIALKHAGADVLVAGSAVFKAANPKGYIADLLNA